MKFSVVLAATLSAAVFASPLTHFKKQGLGGLLGGGDENLNSSDGASNNFPSINTGSIMSSGGHYTDTGSVEGLSGLGGLFTGFGTHAKASKSAITQATTHPSSATTFTTPIKSSQPTSLSVTTESKVVTPMSSSSATQAAGSSSGYSKTWMVIGVTVISVTAVSALIVFVIFFDRIIRFLRSVFLGKQRSQGYEDFIPDWEKATWEVRGDGNTVGDYPVVPYSSFEGIAQNLKPPSLLADKDPVVGTGTRHPFPFRPNPMPVYVSFTSPPREQERSMQLQPNSSMTTAEQNSLSTQDAYTACA